MRTSAAGAVAQDEARDDGGNEDARAGRGEQVEVEDGGLRRAAAATTGGTFITRLCRPATGKLGDPDAVQECLDLRGAPEEDEDATG